MRPKRTVVALLALPLLLILVLLVLADVAVLTADGIVSTEVITSPGNVTGTYDGFVTVVSGWSADGDSATMNISNFAGSGTINAVVFDIKLRTTAGSFSDDYLIIQYSNNSGTSWTNAQSNVQPGATLTTYGNYTVTTAFPVISSVDAMQVRLLYERVGGSDGITLGIDGVAVHVTYTPPDLSPPNVTLNRPLNFTFLTNRSVIFNITARDAIGLANCSLNTNVSLSAHNLSPSNTAFTYLNLTFATDGDFLWNVTCYDTSANANVSNTTFITRIDTTAPIVSLVAPANYNETSFTLVNFTYNVTDAASIASCSLVIDDIERQVNTTVAVNINQTFLQTLQNGNRSWYVNCTDANGWTGQSALRYVYVNSPTPVVVSDFSSYIQGETVLYRGQNWQAGANVSVNTTLANGSMLNHTALANSSGGINATLLLGYAYPTGQYNVFAYQLNDSSYNASTTYSVSALIASLTTDTTSYVQGETVFFIGANFSPNSTVNFTIRLPGGTSNQTNLTVNASGGFAFNLTLNLTHPIGSNNATATDRNFSNLNATVAFIVTTRVPTITKNATTYTVNGSALFLGTYYTISGNILVRIYNTITGLPGLEFPVTRVANASGTFNLTWFVNNTCAGNYTIIGEDQNTTSYTANLTFLVVNQYNQSLQARVRNVSGNINTTPSVAAVNASDNTLQLVGLSAANLNGWLRFGFFPNLPANATFLAVNVTLEHRRTSNKVTSFQMFIEKNGVLTQLVGTGCSGTPPDVEGTTQCDITSQINNVSVANALYILVNYTRSTGGGGDVEVDTMIANYSWRGDPYGCTIFGNTPVSPSVESSGSPGTVVLNAGTTRRVECNVTVTDANGVDEILGANATFWTPPSVMTSLDSNVSHYTNASCAETAFGPSSRDYSCSALLYYYAANGSWWCNVTGVSSDGTGTNVSQFFVDPLYALNVSVTFLEFGNLATGQISANLSENVTNVGNQRINVSVYGYGTQLGDGQGFRCATENISIEFVRYSSVIGHAYADKRSLALTPAALNLTVAAQTIPGGAPLNTSYWQVQVPSNLSSTGSCNGTIVFQAEAN